MESQPQNNQLQNLKTTDNLLIKIGAKTNLLTALEKGNNRQVATILKQYKTKSGTLDFPAILSVPTAERIPALFKRDFMYCTTLVVAALAGAFDRMGFKKEFDAVRTNDLAEEIIDSAEDDNIGIEDLLLFLQGMVRGEYGLLETMSIPRFMSLFDKYRNNRHTALIEYRENEHLQFKGLGDAGRSNYADPLSDHFSKLGNSLHELRISMNETKKENNILKQVDKL